MNELYKLESVERVDENSESRYFQIDFLKAIMIFLVIFDHFVYWDVKDVIGVALWERISIPIFLVIMGFNMGLSFKRHGATTLRELYSWRYFKSKILRYIIPFLVLYGFSTLIGLALYDFDIIDMWNGQYYPHHGIINLFTGFLPFWGPGNWFIPVVFQSILVLPLIYWAFTKKPYIAIFLCFTVEIIMQLIVFFFIGELNSWEEYHILMVFMTSVLFYSSAIGIGMCLSFQHDIKSERNIFIWTLLPISLMYLIFYQFFGLSLLIDGVPLLRGDYHFLVIPYSAFLFLLVVNFFPKSPNNRTSRFISLIGKSTYHILLIQILGYGMIYFYWGDHYGMFLPFQWFDLIELIILWIVFISFGILWYKIDQNRELKRRILYYFNLFTVFVSLLLLSFWAQGFWIPIPLIIIIVYAIGAALINFIIKNPIKTSVLGIWTGFLMLTLIMMLLQIFMFVPSDYWISLLIIGIYLGLAVAGTIIIYKRIK